MELKYILAPWKDGSGPPFDNSGRMYLAFLVNIEHYEYHKPVQLYRRVVPYYRWVKARHN